MLSKIIRDYKWYSFLLASIFVSFLLHVVINEIDFDEREHFYASYLVSLGKIPYLDFFEHHHPLMWYIYAPLFSWLDENAYIWYILRCNGILIVLLMCLFVYKIIYLLKNKHELGLIGVAFLLGVNNVGLSGVEFRPDNLMLLFFVIGLYELFSYLKRQKLFQLHLAMFSFYLSFLVLQKIIVSGLLVGIVLFYFIKKGNLKFRDLLLSLTFPVLYSLVLLAKLYQLDLLDEYWIMNWLLNQNRVLEIFFEKDTLVFPIIGFIFSIIVLFSKKYDVYVRSFAFMAVTSFLLYIVILPVLGVSYLYLQYLLPVYPLYAIVFAVMIEPLLKSKFIFRASILLVSGCYLFGVRQIFMYKKNRFKAIDVDRSLDEIVYQNTKKTDIVFCDIDRGTVGVMRSCAQGFFFFGLHSKGAEYSLKYHRKEVPILDRVIKVRRPKIVAHVMWPSCNLSEDKQDVKCSWTQFLDDPWMNVYYTYNNFFWIRRY